VVARLVRDELFFVAAAGLSRSDGFGSRHLTVGRGLGHFVDDQRQIPHWDRGAGSRGFAHRS
jgi:hypothetical protein